MKSLSGPLGFRILRYTKAKDLKKIQYLILRTHFKAYWNFPIYTFHLMSPTWRQKRFCKRRGLKTFENKLFERTFWRENWKKVQRKTPRWGLSRIFFLQRTLSEVEDRKQALQQKRKENKRILPFVTQFQPSVPLKQILMSKWHLITNQPLLKETFWGASINIIQERMLFTGYTRMSKIVIKAKIRARESHRPVTPILNNFFLQRFFQSKHCEDPKVMFKDLQSTLFTLYGGMIGCTLTWPVNEKILRSVAGRIKVLTKRILFT